LLNKVPDTFLIISNTALGDTILSTPAIKSLKKSFPNSKIIAVLNSKFSPLFKNFKYIDYIIEYNGKYKNFFKTINKIKKERPKVALILHSNSPQDIQLCVLSGCEFILKHPTKTNLKKYLSFDFEKKEQHTIEDRLDLVRLLGAKVIDTTMEIQPLNDEHYKKKYTKYKNFIGFQVGAANEYKMWPIERFIELAKKILANSNENIVITGIKKEWELGEKIVKVCGDRVVNMCGKCTIEELPYLIKNLKMIITNDTGTMHLAISLKTPTICLFSPTSAKGIGPYQDLNIHKVIQKNGEFIQKLPKKERDNSAMKLIEVEEVFEKYRELNNEILYV